MMVLIDSGASHIFISLGLVWSLGLQVETTPPYNIRLGDKYQKQTQGCCRVARVQVQGFCLN